MANGAVQRLNSIKKQKKIFTKKDMLNNYVIFDSSECGLNLPRDLIFYLY